jgi:hypothetical protein
MITCDCLPYSSNVTWRVFEFAVVKIICVRVFRGVGEQTSPNEH